MASSHGSIYSFKVDDASNTILSVREEKPAHYIMEIESFTEFKDSIEGEDEDYLESMEFIAAGHRWVLIIHPHGNTGIGEEDHISLYLKLISRPVDAIPTSTGRLSTLNARTRDDFTWTFDKFSKITDSKSSDDFDMEERTWELEIYPKGWGEGKRKSLTLFLNLLDCSDLTGGKKLYVDTTVRIINQLCEELMEDSISGWYTKECDGIAAIHLLSLSDLHNKDKGFKMDDQVIVEVEFKLVMLVDEF
ncbi:MATH domain and coiled-coil domain-containing protein [Drosera capensis]